MPSYIPRSQERSQPARMTACHVPYVFGSNTPSSGSSTFSFPIKDSIKYPWLTKFRPCFEFARTHNLSPNLYATDDKCKNLYTERSSITGGPKVKSFSSRNLDFNSSFVPIVNTYHLPYEDLDRNDDYIPYIHKQRHYKDVKRTKKHFFRFSPCGVHTTPVADKYQTRHIKASVKLAYMYPCGNLSIKSKDQCGNKLQTKQLISVVQQSGLLGVPSKIDVYFQVNILNALDNILHTSACEHDGERQYIENMQEKIQLMIGNIADQSVTNYQRNPMDLNSSVDAVVFIGRILHNFSRVNIDLAGSSNIDLNTIDQKWNSTHDYRTHLYDKTILLRVNDIINWREEYIFVIMQKSFLYATKCVEVSTKFGNMDYMIKNNIWEKPFAVPFALDGGRKLYHINLDTENRHTGSNIFLPHMIPDNFNMQCIPPHIDDRLDIHLRKLLVWRAASILYRGIDAPLGELDTIFCDQQALQYGIQQLMLRIREGGFEHIATVTELLRVSTIHNSGSIDAALQSGIALEQYILPHILGQPKEFGSLLGHLLQKELPGWNNVESLLMKLYSFYLGFSANKNTIEYLFTNTKEEILKSFFSYANEEGLTYVQEILALLQTQSNKLEVAECVIRLFVRITEDKKWPSSIHTVFINDKNNSTLNILTNIICDSFPKDYGNISNDVWLDRDTKSLSKSDKLLQLIIANCGKKISRIACWGVVKDNIKASTIQLTVSLVGLLLESRCLRHTLTHVRDFVVTNVKNLVDSLMQMWYSQDNEVVQQSGDVPIDFSRLMSMFSAMDTVMSSDVLNKIVEAFTMITGIMGCPTEKMDIKGLFNWSKTVEIYLKENMSSALAPVSLVQRIWGICKFFILRGRIAWELGDVRSFFFYSDEYHSFITDVRQLGNVIDRYAFLSRDQDAEVNGHVWSKKGFTEIFDRCAARALQIKRDKDRGIITRLPPTLVLAIENFYKINNTVQLFSRMSALRLVPPAICIYGNAGAGKTTNLKGIVDSIFARCYTWKFTYDKDGAIVGKEKIFAEPKCYTKTATEKYFSGYTNDVNCLNFAEIGLIKENVAPELVMNNINNLMCAIDGAPFAPEMAELQNKGNIFVSPSLVTITTNVPDLGAQRVMVWPEALYRRITHIELALKPQYETGNGSKTFSYAKFKTLHPDEENPFNVDCWTYKYYSPKFKSNVSLNDPVNSVEWVLAQEFSTQYDFLMWLTHKIQTHYDNQAEVLRQEAQGKFKGICPECFKYHKPGVDVCYLVDDSLEADNSELNNVAQQSGWSDRAMAVGIVGGCVVGACIANQCNSIVARYCSKLSKRMTKTLSNGISVKWDRGLGVNIVPISESFSPVSTGLHVLQPSTEEWAIWIQSQTIWKWMKDNVSLITSLTTVSAVLAYLYWSTRRVEVVEQMNITDNELLQRIYGNLSSGARHVMPEIKPIVNMWVTNSVGNYALDHRNTYRGETNVNLDLARIKNSMFTMYIMMGNGPAVETQALLYGGTEYCFNTHSLMKVLLHDSKNDVELVSFLKTEKTWRTIVSHPKLANVKVKFVLKDSFNVGTVSIFQSDSPSVPLQLVAGDIGADVCLVSLTMSMKPSTPAIKRGLLYGSFSEPSKTLLVSRKHTLPMNAAICKQQDNDVGSAGSTMFSLKEVNLTLNGEEVTGKYWTSQDSIYNKDNFKNGDCGSPLVGFDKRDSKECVTVLGFHRFLGPNVVYSAPLSYELLHDLHVYLITAGCSEQNGVIYRPLSAFSAGEIRQVLPTHNARYAPYSDDNDNVILYDRKLPVDVDNLFHTKSPLNWMGTYLPLDYNKKVGVAKELHGYPIGSSRGHRYGKFVSNVCTSPMAQWYRYPVTHVAPPLEDKRGKEVNLVALSGIPTKNIDLALLNELSEGRFREIVRKLNNKRPGWRKEIHPLTDMQAVTGADGASYLPGINRKSGAGDPYNVPKSKIIEVFRDKEGKVAKIHLESAVAENIDYMRKCYLNGERANPVFRATPKDEPLSLLKAKTFDIRIFLCAPYDLIHLERQYYLPLVRLICLEPEIFEMAVGTNVNSRRWGKMAQWLHDSGADSERIIAGDYSKFDKTISIPFIRSAFEILINLARISEEFTMSDIAILEGIAHDVMNPLYDWFGDLFLMENGHPSGHGLTTIINGLVNQLFLRYATILSARQRHFPLHVDDWARYVRLYTYGDDNICGVSNVAEEYVNMYIIVEELEKIGVVYTKEDKSEVTSPFILFSEASFLKRKWIECDNWVCAPLEEKSLCKMVTTWTKSTNITMEAQVWDVLMSYLREWAHYGPQRFERERVNILKLLSDEDYWLLQGHPMSTHWWNEFAHRVPTYDSVRTSWEEADFVSLVEIEQQSGNFINRIDNNWVYSPTFVPLNKSRCVIYLLHFLHFANVNTLMRMDITQGSGSKPPELFLNKELSPLTKHLHKILTFKPVVSMVYFKVSDNIKQQFTIICVPWR